MEHNGYYLSSFLSLLLLLMIQTVFCNDGYLIIAPAVFRPGVSELISITILNPSTPITVQSKLVTQDGVEIAQVGREIFGKGSLILKVPENSKGLAQLKVCGNCLSSETEGYSFFNSSSVMIEERGSMLFIDTDKPIYKPGQTVFISIMATSIDLKPVRKEFTIYMEDGQGNKVAKWDNPAEICLGVYEVSLPLSSQPVLDEWTIRSTVEGHDYNKTFTVGEYVLPRFTVDVTPPSYIRNWNTCHPVTVSARYVYARDVHGRLTASVTLKGLGYYSDYHGETTNFDQPINGVTTLSVCLSDLIQSEVGEHFRGHLQIEVKVVTPDGREVMVTDGTCIVNKQMVDIKFSPDTRRHFKPGIPFKGKVNIINPDGTPAENVTVVIRTDVNGGNFSAKIYDVTSGVVNFAIPELPLATNVVWIEAKVLQVGGTDVSHAYLSSHLSITGWYSPSKCQALVESLDTEFKVGKDARFELKSTCPCNFTLFFEVISRGNIVDSGIHYSHHHDKRETDVTFTGDKPFPKRNHHPICMTYFKFTITPKMVPLSRLLVYYVRENGEGVADTLTLNIEPTFENKLTILPSVKYASPGDNVKVTTRTLPDSCICLTATDKSLYFQGAKDRVNSEKIFQEVTEFDVTLVEQEEPYWWSFSRRQKRSLNLWSLMKNRDAQYAFEEAGMMVMTDKVRLHHGKDLGSISGPIFHRPGYLPVEAMEVYMRDRMNHNKVVRRHRAFFPETWFRKCYNATSTNKYTSFRSSLPDSLTSWTIDGFSISPKDGIAVAKSADVTVQKEFFIEFNLPYSVVRQEKVKIPITLHNYFNFCTEVYLEISAPSEVDVHIDNPIDDKIAVCVGKNISVTQSVVTSFGSIGNFNITAIAEAYPSLRCCSGTPTTNWSLIRRKILGYDHVTRVVKVKAEGIPKTYKNSAFLCPKERLQITTPPEFVYQYLSKPDGLTGFTFTVRAASAIHVILTTLPGNARETVEIVLGGNDNSLSSIISGQEGGDSVTSTASISLSTAEYRAFWVTWNQNHVRVGMGLHENYNELMSLLVGKDFDVKYIGFATSSGLTANFKIWTDRDGTYGEVFHLGLPSNRVPDSAHGKVTLIGDIMGPAMKNVDHLLELPHGCGEQNMIFFAPNIYIQSYLKLTNQLRDDADDKSLQLLRSAYQRQLTYQRSDGSFSAFGEKDSSGSIWLSTFVLQSFLQAKQFIYIDQAVIERTENWILAHQNDDGSFPTVGRVINKLTQEDGDISISLTAYVLTTLIQLPYKDDEFVEYSIEKATSYLEENVALISNPYTTALCAYAQTLVNSNMALMTLRKLNQMAIVSDDVKFWKVSSEEPVQTDFIFTLEEDMTKIGSSAEVEVAAYALLIYSARGDVTSGLPVVKWLSKRRNALGGFSSTHDTSIALHALSKFAALIYSNDLNITVTLASTNLDLQRKLTLHHGNRDIVQSVTIPTLPTGVFVSGVGEGCALLQLEVTYNIPDPEVKGQSFYLSVSSKITTKGDKHEVDLQICTSWMHAGSSNMAVAEVELISGFSAEKFSLDDLLQRDENIKRYEIENKKVIFYFDQIDSKCVTCLTFKTVELYHVGNAKPAEIQIYDYYEPGYKASQVYSPALVDDIGDLQCDEKHCNQIPIKQDENILGRTVCHSPQGCEQLPIPNCRCYEDCSGSNSPVCGSDGVMYDGKCHLEISACEKSMLIEVVEETFCETGASSTSNGLPDNDDKVIS